MQILQVDDVPYTVNMKRVEVPVKKVSRRGGSWASRRLGGETWTLRGPGDQIINGAPLSSVNPATLRNPECLAAYEAIGVRLRAEVA